MVCWAGSRNRKHGVWPWFSHSLEQLWLPRGARRAVTVQHSSALSWLLGSSSPGVAGLTNVTMPCCRPHHHHTWGCFLAELVVPEAVLHSAERGEDTSQSRETRLLLACS